MKKCTLLTMLLFYLFISSCSVNLDFDDTQGYISVKVKGNNTTGNVSNNGFLDLNIIGEDDDGIAHISIKIPVLNVDLIIDNNSGTDRWEISQTFNVIDPIGQGIYSIHIILKDRNGNEYIKTAKFRVS